MTKITFGLSPEGETEIQKLMRLAECANEGQLMRNALNVYSLLLTRLAAGDTLIIREADGTLARLDILKFENPPT